jgi:hypothetical protein
MLSSLAALLKALRVGGGGAGGYKMLLTSFRCCDERILNSYSLKVAISDSSQL